MGNNKIQKTLFVFLSYTDEKYVSSASKQILCWDSCVRQCKETTYGVEMSSLSFGNEVLYQETAKLEGINKTKDEVREYIR